MIDDRHEPIRGWLLLFCLLLGVWEPLSLALAASRLLPGLVYGGTPAAASLALRVAVTGVGVAAALALWNGHGAGVTMAKLFLVLSAGLGLVIPMTAAWLSSLAPSERRPALGLLAIYHAAWYIYLLRSKRVRRTYGLG